MKVYHRLANTPVTTILSLSIPLGIKEKESQEGMSSHSTSISNNVLQSIIIILYFMFVNLIVTYHKGDKIILTLCIRPCLMYNTQHIKIGKMYVQFMRT